MSRFIQLYLLGMQSKTQLHLYPASAGSGKTYQLVTSYLKMALAEEKSPQHSFILASTFTKKAAGEMKERVIKFLSEMAFSPNENEAYVKEIKAHLGVDTEELQKRAMLLLTDILHYYSFFSLLTLDSFSLRMLRSFAEEIGLPRSFAVEMDDRELKEQIIDQLFDEAASDDNIRKAMIQWIKMQADAKKSVVVENSIRDLMREVFQESALEANNALKKVPQKEILKIISERAKYLEILEGQRKEICQKAIETLKSSELVAEDFKGKSRSSMKIFQDIVDGKKQCLSATQKKFFESDEWYTKGSDKEPLIVATMPRLKEVYNELNSWEEQHYNKLVMLKNSNATNALLILSKTILSLKEEWSKKRGLLPIFDFVPQFYQLMQAENADFVYEKIGQRFSTFMLDEFQDTSEKQWGILYPLIENALAQGGEAIVVGDVKQSIYRFRNASPHLFEGMLNGKMELPFTREVHPKEFNFRSAQNIVALNNDLLSVYDQYLGESSDTYQQGAQKYISKEPGYVNVKLASELNAAEFKEWANAKLLEDIKQILNNGFEPKDLALLTSSNKDNMALSQLLVGEGYDVIVEGSLKITDDIHVSAVWNALVLQSLFSASHFVSYLIAMAQLIEMDQALVLYQGFKEPEKLISAFETYWGRSVDKKHLFPLISEQASLYDSIKHLAFAKSADVNIYKQCFVEYVHHAIHVKKHTLSSLGWQIQQEKDIPNVSTPEGVNAIKILTSHKAKGLEFPVVMVPYFTGSTRRTKDYHWLETGDEGLPYSLLKIDKSLEGTVLEPIYHDEEFASKKDAINKVYVALTRPESGLFVYGKTANEKAKTLYPLVSQYFQNHEKFDANLNELTIGTLPVLNKEGKIESKNIPQNTSFKLNENAIRLQPLTKEQSLGNEIHSLLEKVNSIEDLGQLILNNSEWIEPISEVVNQGEQEGWLGQGLEAYNEREWAFQENNEWQTIRPDRVVLKPIQLVIDYKTGQPQPEHQQQVDQYAEVLKNIYKMPFETKLVYINA